MNIMCSTDSNTRTTPNCDSTSATSAMGSTISMPKLLQRSIKPWSPCKTQFCCKCISDFSVSSKAKFIRATRSSSSPSRAGTPPCARTWSTALWMCFSPRATMDSTRRGLFKSAVRAWLLRSAVSACRWRLTDSRSISMSSTPGPCSAEASPCRTNVMADCSAGLRKRRTNRAFVLPSSIQTTWRSDELLLWPRASSARSSPSNSDECTGYCVARHKLARVVSEAVPYCLRQCGPSRLAAGTRALTTISASSSTEL
mmetsp:Transcript_12529/g.34625  ORF Transcript_12529/g.34625 Transcript_12529/m.34625 type:complete len:256 (-) Transcript_12529:965-1732(-)